MFGTSSSVRPLDKRRSIESDSEVDGRGGASGAHGTAAELEQAQGGIERSRFSPGRIAEFKELAADPRVYDKVGCYIRFCPCPTKTSYPTLAWRSLPRENGSDERRINALPMTGVAALLLSWQRRRLLSP